MGCSCKTGCSLTCGCRQKNNTCGPGCKCGPSCRNTVTPAQTSSSGSKAFEENEITSTESELNGTELSYVRDNLAILEEGDDDDYDFEDDEEYDDYDDFDDIQL